MKQYLFNPNTGTLHIYGFCCHAKHTPAHYKCFDTEQEVYQYAGRAVKICKICQKEKEERIRM